MASKIYVGKTPETPEGVVTRLSGEQQLGTGPSQVYVDTQVINGADLLADKAYVDAADNTFVEASYVATQDALNLPTTAKGAANGVASLVGGTVPYSQLPGLGAGILRGPWGVSTTASGTTGATPLKMGTWNIGQTTWNFRPLVFLVAQVDVSQGGRPCVEVRIGTSADTTYESQTLVASGIGRARFDDVQSVTVLPAGVPGAMSDGIQTYYAPTYNAQLTAWVYNIGQPAGQVTVTTTSMWSAAAYIARIQD